MPRLPRSEALIVLTNLACGTALEHKADADPPNSIAFLDAATL
jgi:hypothetical protein